jgi:hypothetical protein
VLLLLHFAMHITSAAHIYSSDDNIGLFVRTIRYDSSGCKDYAPEGFSPLLFFF